MSDFAQKIEGKVLLQFIMERCNMTREEAIDNMTEHNQDMSFLQVGGIDTVIDSDWAQFPHDGTVWRLDDNEKFRDLGYTSHHPRGAFAVKKQQKGVTTTLLDVDWQVGKSGVVSPVAILEPCTIGEATVSRATLHNKSYIEELGLYIGCEVEVIRSGEIIPRIVGLAEK